MEVSDTLVLLAVDGSSLSLAHKADLQMRSRAVLRAPRQTDRQTNSMLWNGNALKQQPLLFLGGPRALRQAKAELQAALHSCWLSQDVAPSPHLGHYMPEKGGT